MRLLINPTVLTFSFEIPSMPATTGVQKILGMAIGLKHHRVDYFPYWHRSNSILLGASAAVKDGPVKLWNYSYVDGKKVQREMGVYEVGTELQVRLRWNNPISDIEVRQNNQFMDYSVVSLDPPITLPVGYILKNYMEEDGNENKQIPFKVNIWDIKVNPKN